MKKLLLGLAALGGILCIASCNDKKDDDKIQVTSTENEYTVSKDEFIAAMNIINEDNVTLTQKSYYKNEISSTITFDKVGKYMRGTVNYNSDILEDDTYYYYIDCDYYACYEYEYNQYVQSGDEDDVESFLSALNSMTGISGTLYDNALFDYKKNRYIIKDINIGDTYSEIISLSNMTSTADYIIKFEDKKVKYVEVETTTNYSGIKMTSKTVSEYSYGNSTWNVPQDLITKATSDYNNQLK